MIKELEALGIPCTLVLDSAIGYIMSEIDYVLVGAEGVVESGGIINKASLSYPVTSHYLISIIAHGIKGYLQL